MLKPFWLVAPHCVVLVSTQACTYSTNWQRSNEAGYEAYKQARYDDAEKAYLAALKEAENFGPQDSRLATPLNNLAALYDAQGKYTEAEPLYQRSLAIWENALGPEHPNVAMSRQNYAGLRRSMGRAGEAARLGR